MSFIRAALGLLFPTAVVSTVWVLRLPVISVIPDWGLRYGPYLVIALGTALALRFNKSRALFTLIVLALTFWVLTSYAPEPRHNTLAYVLCSILIPINVLFFYLTRERGVLTSHGLACLSFIIGQAGAAYWLSHHPSFDLFAWLTQQFLALPGGLHLQLSQAGAAASMLAAILITINYIIDPAGLDGLFLGALVALFFGFNWIGSTAVLPLFVAMAAALLLFGIIQEPYSMTYKGTAKDAA